MIFGFSYKTCDHQGLKKQVKSPSTVSRPPLTSPMWGGVRGHDKLVVSEHPGFGSGSDPPIGLDREGVLQLKQRLTLNNSKLCQQKLKSCQSMHKS